MRTIAVLAAAALAACAPAPQEPGARIGGPYVLAPAPLSAAGGKIVCYRTDGRCDVRIPAYVACLGADEDYIVAGVRKPGDPGVLQYYYLVRLFDHPEADGRACLADAIAAAPAPGAKDDGVTSGGEQRDLVNCARRKAAVPAAAAEDESGGAAREPRGDSQCAVRGPFTLRQFDAERRRHCVPAGEGSAARKCMPDPTARVW